MTGEDFYLEVQTFDGAVAWATKSLKAAKRLRPEWFVPGSWEENERLETGKMALKHGFKEHAELARKDFHHHRAMALGCASSLRNGEELPAWTVNWLVDFLEGNQKAPSAPRGARSLAFLHSLVGNLIDNLVEAGWTALRNDDKEIRCACDVLAQALKASGLQPATFEGVKKLYVNRNRDLHGNERAFRSRL